MEASISRTSARARAVPGRPDREEAWGEAPLVVDTSAWARASHTEVRDAWQAALRADRIRLLPLVGLEILLSARDGDSFDEVGTMLSAVRPAPLSPSVLGAARNGMRELAHQSSGAHRIPLVDYLVAASAQELGATVLHYDHDFDTLAEVMEFDSRWLAPAGSMP